jgi:hypothetical protein
MLKKISDYQPVVTILNKPIKQVFQCKTLGVTVDENLSWKSNIESICSKISSGIYHGPRARQNPACCKSGPP